jgi:hypothetical protein
MVMIHGPNGETTAPASAHAAVESPAHDTPVTIPGPVPGPPTAPESEASVADGADPAGQRAPRTFKFREDYVPAAEPLVAKTPPGPRIPNPPKAAGPAVKAPSTDASETEPTAVASVSSAASRRLRQWLLIGGAACAGIVLALLLVGFVASRFGAPPLPVAEGPAEEQPALPTPTGPPSESQAAGTPPAADTSKPKTPADSSESTKEHAIAPEPAPPQEDSTGKAQPPTEAAKPAAVVDAEASKNGTPADATPPDAAPAADAGPDNPAAPTEEVKVEGKVGGDAMTDGAAPESLPAHDQVSPGSAAALPTSLTQVIPALEFRDKPLIIFADFIADFTALPVSLDIDAMLVAHIAPDTSLDFDRQQVTIDEVLQTVLEPVGLKYSVASGQLVIAPQRDVNQEVEQTAYDVSDLASDDEQTQALAKLIVTMIMPGSWADVGGSAILTVGEQSLDIEQTAAGHFHVARFLDRLRLARGLLPRSELPDAVLDLTPVFVQAGGDLSRTLSASFTEPTEVARILDYLRGESKLHLIVDWPATGQVNWLPTTKSTLSSQVAQPLSKLLDDWLAPVQLSYRVIDGGTIQISSQAVLEHRPEIEIYPLKGDTDQNTAQLIQDLKLHLGPAVFADGGGSGQMVFEPGSRSLLVLLPQPQQRKVAAWLTTADKLRVTADATAE